MNPQPGRPKESSLPLGGNGAQSEHVVNAADPAMMARETSPPTQQLPRPADDGPLWVDEHLVDGNLPDRGVRVGRLRERFVAMDRRRRGIGFTVRPFRERSTIAVPSHGVARRVARVGSRPGRRCSRPPNAARGLAAISFTNGADAT